MNIEYFSEGAPCFRTASRVGELARLGASSDREDQLIVCLPDVVAPSISDQLTSSPTWLAESVKTLDRKCGGWWYRTPRMNESTCDTGRLLEELAARSNVVFTSLIRSFDDTQSIKGSVEWLESVIEGEPPTPLMQAFAAILVLFKTVNKFGLHAYVEKIAGCLSTHETRYVTLTPQAHRDGNYGYLESAVLSLYSSTRYPMSSPIFLPTVDWESMSALKPVTAEKLVANVPGLTGYAGRTGDLLVFSGKNTGAMRDDRCGALHISPEGFLSTERISFLIRLQHDS